MGKNTTDLTDLVSYVDAYSATGVYPSKIYKWVEEGRLQEYRVNNLGEVKVLLSDVKKLKGTIAVNLEASLQNAHKRISQLMEDVSKLKKDSKPKDEYLTIRKAAWKFKVKNARVRKLVESGELKTHKDDSGEVTLVLSSDVERLLREEVRTKPQNKSTLAEGQDFISIGEACGRFGVGISRLNEWVKSGVVNGHFNANLANVTYVSAIEVARAINKYGKSEATSDKMQKANTRIKELEEKLAERDASAPSLAGFIEYAERVEVLAKQAAKAFGTDSARRHLEKMSYLVNAAREYAEGTHK